MKKDKEKVLDEAWTDERVRGFLDIQSFDDTNRDFHMLLKAYQSMRAEDFGKFINYFLEAGHDLNATDGDGQSVLSIVQQHRRSAEYADLLKAAGAA